MEAYYFVSSFQHVPLSLLRDIFDACDKEVLQRDFPIPVGVHLEDETHFSQFRWNQRRHSLFRGCAGSEHRMGMSWTSSLDKAIWYAAHHAACRHLANTAVYATTASRDEIYCCAEQHEYLYRAGASRVQHPGFRAVSAPKCAILERARVLRKIVSPGDAIAQCAADPRIAVAINSVQHRHERSNRSFIENGSIRIRNRRIAVVGTLRRFTVFMWTKPTASNLPRVRTTFGAALPVISASSAIDCGFRSRMTASSARFSGVRSRSRAPTELKLGSAASAGGRLAPRATDFISSLRSPWL